MGSDEPVTEKLRKWMIASGRALEMEVAREFMRRATTVEQSPYYEDPDTGKIREMDVVAIYSSNLRQYVVSAASECKHSPEPFLVLLPSTSERVDMLRYRCLSRSAREKMPDQNSTVSIDLNGTALFDPAKPVGYSVITMTKSKKRPAAEREGGEPTDLPLPGDKVQADNVDRGYWAAVSAVKAAGWYATAKEDTEHTETHVSFPIVVTDGVLATAQLVPSGNVDVHEVEHARVLLKRPLGDTPAVIVDFVRASYLPAFADEVASAAELLLKALAPTNT